MFQGLVRCPNCGYLVIIDMKRKKSGKVYKYLVCQHCKHSVSEKEAENAFLDIMNGFSKIPAKIYDRIVSHLNEKMNSDHEIEMARKSTLEREITVAKKRQEKLLEVYIDEKINEETFDAKRLDLEDEIAKKEEELSNLRGSSEKTIISTKLLINIIKNVKILYKSSSFEEKRMLLKLLCSNFFLDEKNLIISIRKPLSSILGRGFRPDWLGNLDSNQD